MHNSSSVTMKSDEQYYVFSQCKFKIELMKQTNLCCFQHVMWTTSKKAEAACIQCAWTMW